MRCNFLPPKIADELVDLVGHNPHIDTGFREARAISLGPGLSASASGIYTAKGREVTPGTKLTVPYTDQCAQEADNAMSGTEAALTILGEKMPGRVGTVHYGDKYDNAFWDGDQMVFGDGDGQYLNRFTIDEDITAHELGHGVTGDLLNYQDQAGALNEHMSDALGASVRQYMRSMAPDAVGAWLIGSHLFVTPSYGEALRNMLNPGTAYNNPYFGADDQPAHMSGYVNTSEDNGGVHTNSGIPNRAFALTAIALGSSFDAFRIWRRALISVNDPNCTFEKFAKACVVQAGDAQRLDVLKAWQEVGVLKASEPVPSGGQPSSDGPFRGASPQVAARILHAAGSSDPLVVARWMNHHFGSYFRIKP